MLITPGMMKAMPVKNTRAWRKSGRRQAAMKSMPMPRMMRLIIVNPLCFMIVGVLIVEIYGVGRGGKVFKVIRVFKDTNDFGDFGGAFVIFNARGAFRFNS